MFHMLECFKCSFINPDGSKYCQKCGMKLQSKKLGATSVLYDDDQRTTSLTIVLAVTYLELAILGLTSLFLSLLDVFALAGTANGINFILVLILLPMPAVLTIFMFWVTNGVLNYNDAARKILIALHILIAIPILILVSAFITFSMLNILAFGIIIFILYVLSFDYQSIKLFE